MNENEKTLLTIGIIIVAVVGASIILAAWMGELGPGFMGPVEELKVLKHTWGSDNAFIVLSVKNTGNDFSVSSVRVNDMVVAESNVAYGGSFTGTTHTLRPGASGIIIITHAFVSDTKYEFAVVSATGNKYPYVVRCAEELHVTAYTWGLEKTNITLSVENTGFGALSVSSVRVDGVSVAQGNVAYGGDFTGTYIHTLDQGKSGTITITHVFVSGTEYEFELITERGNKYKCTIRSTELQVNGHTWGVEKTNITLSVKNTGLDALSVSSVQVNYVSVAEGNLAYGGDFTMDTHTLDQGKSGTITITHVFVSDTKYEFILNTTTSNVYCRYVVTTGIGHLAVINHDWASDLTYFDLSVNNTGDFAVSMSETRVNFWVTESNVTSTPLQPGDSVVVRITPRIINIINYPIVEPPTFTSGDEYVFMIDTLTHKALVSYFATAP